MARRKRVLSHDDKALTAGQVAKFDQLQQRLARADLRPRQRGEVLDALHDLEFGQRVERERREIELGILETIALAEQRLEEVSATKAGGARITSRDGLRSLFERGRLSVDQYEAGLVYRRGRESRERDLRTQLWGEGVRGLAHDNHKFVADRFDRAKSIALIGRIERAVALRCRHRPVCLSLLRWVAGDGHSITAFGDGRALAQNVEALAIALEIVGDIHRAQRKEQKANIPLDGEA